MPEGAGAEVSLTLTTSRAKTLWTRKPVSRVLFAPCGVWQPFLWDVHCWTPRATHPGHGH